MKTPSDLTSSEQALDLGLGRGELDDGLGVDGEAAHGVVEDRSDAHDVEGLAAGEGDREYGLEKGVCGVLAPVGLQILAEGLIGQLVGLGEGAGVGEVTDEALGAIKLESRC